MNIAKSIHCGVLIPFIISETVWIREAIFSGFGKSFLLTI